MFLGALGPCHAMIIGKMSLVGDGEIREGWEIEVPVAD